MAIYEDTNSWPLFAYIRYKIFSYVLNDFTALSAMVDCYCRVL